MQRTWSSVAERPDASMSLLREVVEGADDGYAEAYAAQRTGDPASGEPTADPRRAWWGRPVTAVLLLGLGLVAGQTIATARVEAPAVASSQQRLQDDVTRQTTATDALAGRVHDLQAQVTALQAARGAQSDSNDELNRLRIAVGTVAVHGPGVVVHLDDAAQPPADAVGGAAGAVGTDDGRVHDHELQAVANQLWAGGAEAISVNGLRLTPRTAIREAGQAILVDFRPISPPYTVRAIGDPQALQTSFVGSEIARKLQTYVAVLGLSYRLDTAEQLSLPAGGNPPLREAQVAPPAGGSARDSTAPDTPHPDGSTPTGTSTTGAGAGTPDPTETP